MLKSLIKNFYRTGTELPETLGKLYSIFQNSPEGYWILNKENALTLYKLVHQIQPKNILDLGSGIGASTSVLALAAHEGKTTGVEQFKKCIDIAEKLVPEHLLTKNKICPLRTSRFPK